MGEFVQVSEVEEGVVSVVLDRPQKKNALSIALRDEMSDALDLIAADDAVRAVILAAEGDTFCAGFDLSEFSVTEPGFQEQLWRSSDRFHRTVLLFPLPIIAAVQGAALAGGFDLAVMCDIRVAAANASFGHPEQRWSDVVFTPLADLVGSGPARDLCLTGRTIDAATALRIGLVSSVVEIDALAGEARLTAAMVARGPRDALMRTKAKALRRAGHRPDATTLDL
jgi:enoyl-CoA hydratase/carnithine racemase